MCVCVCSLLRVGQSLEASRIPDIGLWGMSLLVTDLHDETPKVNSQYHHTITKVLQFDKR